jgi:hypothetical protein
VFRSRVFRDTTGRKLLNKSVAGVEIRVSSLDGIARRDSLPVPLGWHDGYMLYMAIEERIDCRPTGLGIEC